MPPRIQSFVTLLAACVAASSACAALAPDVQTKIDAQLQVVATWAADPVVVAAVKASNAALPAEHAALTQEKWRALTILDPLARGFAKNPVGQFLKAKKSDLVTEAFVSNAAGLKVGFIAKTSNWSHATSPKHTVPMSGKSWQGPVEIDESAGLQQLQVAVPVLDDGKPIGSLVVGLSLTQLGK